MPPKRTSDAVTPPKSSPSKRSVPKTVASHPCHENITARENKAASPLVNTGRDSDPHSLLEVTHPVMSDPLSGQEVIKVGRSDVRVLLVPDGPNSYSLVTDAFASQPMLRCLDITAVASYFKDLNTVSPRRSSLRISRNFLADCPNLAMVVGLAELDEYVSEVDQDGFLQLAAEAGSQESFYYRQRTELCKFLKRETLSMRKGSPLHGATTKVIMSIMGRDASPFAAIDNTQSGWPVPPLALFCTLAVLAAGLWWAASGASSAEVSGLRPDQTSARDGKWGCSCLTQIGDQRLRSNELVRRMFSPKFKHQSSLLQPLHVLPLQSGALTEVMDTLTAIKSSLPSSSSTSLHIATLSSSLGTVSELEDFLHRSFDSHRGGRGCWYFVLPTTMVSREAIETLKEVAEHNSIRGRRVVPEGHQGAILLVSVAETEDREWLLSVVTHRTAHIMPSVTLR